MISRDEARYDVGIVGVGIGANYGSVLTYYSLYKTIEAFGNKVLMVSKIGARDDDPEIQDTHSMRFAKRHYNLSKIYSQKTVGELNDIVDTFVIGSDQVWNYGVSRGFGKAFYLDFARDDKRKISYAASFGHAKDFAPLEEVGAISALMKRFNAISVREDSGVRLARDVYHVPAKQVSEPIFLMPTEKYMALAQQSTRDVSEPYLLAYILDPTPEKKAAIEHIAGKLGLKIRIILDGWPGIFEENKKKMNILGAVEDGVETYDFLKLYANCSYVLTDSFHGTSFALKFGKPFAAIGNKRRGMARFDSIFRLIGHRNRFTLDPMDIVNDDTRFLALPDYRKIDEILDRHVAESAAWLGVALKGPVKNTIGAIDFHVPKASAATNLTVRKTELLAKRVVSLLKYQVGKRSMQLNVPDFTSNTAAWTVEKVPQFTKLRVMSEALATRGNLVWTDLARPLPVGNAYEMELDWVLRSKARSVNLHLRNPSTGQHRVVGTVVVGSVNDNAPRVDKISFVVPSAGFSQIMLGAVHFTGPDAGADIKRIRLRSIDPANVVPNAASASSGLSKRNAAAVVREMGQRDDQRFIDHYAQHRISRNVGNSRALMMFYAHGFEKGLSRNKNFRPGFGEASMKPLSIEMNQWLAKGGNSQDSFFQVAASVMHVYFARHRALQVDVGHFWKLFHPAVQVQIEQADPACGGSIAANLTREVLVSDFPDRSFRDVVFGRRSVREFNDLPVGDEDIRRAVNIALQAPSVCNRQPVRVHQIEDIEAARAVLELQGGFKGYKLPPKLVLLTSDLSVFVGAVERNQGYIDGGLFMMLFLLALEQLGLGGCCLNTAMNLEREAATRKLLGIPESEVFISYVAIGHYDSEGQVPRSKRLSADDVLIRHD